MTHTLDLPPCTHTHAREFLAQRWPDILQRADLPASTVTAMGGLPDKPTLLGGSTKVDKGDTYGFMSSVCYMSPANEATLDDGRTLCPHSTAACRAACLGHNTGRMIMTPVMRARLWKTALYLGARKVWRRLAHLEIEALERKARRASQRDGRTWTPAVRIDGSTDTGEGQRLAQHHPGVQFWDYTKNLRRALRVGEHGQENYTLVYSHGEGIEQSRQVLDHGGAVAVVFDIKPGEPMPATWLGFPVVNGDLFDNRHADRDIFGLLPRQGYVVGLSFKAARDRDFHRQRGLLSGFIQPV